MKRFILLFWLLFVPFVFSQGEGEEETYPTNELTIQVTDAPNVTVTFELSPVGTVFCGESDGSYEIYEAPSFTHTLYVNSTGDVLCFMNGFNIRECDEGDGRGFVNCGFDYEYAGLGPLRWGFYKMTIKANDVLKGYCYFDWREKKFPNDINCPGGNDMTIRYDGSGNIIFFNEANPDENDPDGITLSNGEIITWAELNCTSRDFSPFWDNGLVVIPSVSNHPRIVWGPYQDGPEPESYKVYRCITSGTPQNFSLIETVSSDEYTFVDEEYTIWPSASTKAYYKVLPYAPSESYSYSNTVNTGIAALKYHIEELKNNFDFVLYQNYPNPFNPSTRITYTIMEDSRVQIKIYDMLGTEVAELVNETKPAGFYETTFDASELSSGVYIYRITVLIEDRILFSQSKQMILLK